MWSLDQSDQIALFSSKKWLRRQPNFHQASCLTANTGRILLLFENDKLFEINFQSYLGILLRNCHSFHSAGHWQDSSWWCFDNNMVQSNLRDALGTFPFQAQIYLLQSTCYFAADHRDRICDPTTRIISPWREVSLFFMPILHFQHSFFLSRFHFDNDFLLGILYSSICAFTAAINVLCVFALKDHFESVSLIFNSSLAGLIFSIAIGPFHMDSKIFHGATSEVHFGVLFGTSCLAILALYLFVTGGQKLEPTLFSFLRSTEILFAFLWQSFSTNSFPDGITILGGVFVILSCLLSGLEKILTPKLRKLRCWAVNDWLAFWPHIYLIFIENIRLTNSLYFLFLKFAFCILICLSLHPKYCITQPLN